MASPESEGYRCHWFDGPRIWTGCQRRHLRRACHAGTPFLLFYDCIQIVMLLDVVLNCVARRIPPLALLAVCPSQSITWNTRLTPCSD